MSLRDRIDSTKLEEAQILLRDAKQGKLCDDRGAMRGMERIIPRGANYYTALSPELVDYIEAHIEVLKDKKERGRDLMFIAPTWWLDRTPEHWKRFVNTMDEQRLIDFRPMREGNKPRLMRNQREVLAVVDVLIFRNVVDKGNGKGGAVAFVVRNFEGRGGVALSKGAIASASHVLKQPKVGKGSRAWATLLVDEITE